MNDRYLAWTAVALLFVLVALSAPGLSQADGGDATVTNVTYDGDAASETAANETVLWREGPHRVAVSISSDSGLTDGSVCLRTDPADDATGSELACRSVSVPAGGSDSTGIEFDAWPVELLGNHSMEAVVRSSGEGPVLDEGSMPVTVLERDGDVDDDGLVNERETALGTKLRANDTDLDGLGDGVEVDTYGTDPTSNDTDGDGLPDRAEIETHQTDPTANDTDGDGLLDDVEVSNATSPTVADTDGDGLDDSLELNTYGTNATEPDSDGDGLDDGSEVREHGTNPVKSDTDGDGLPDNLEIYTYGTDPNAIDTDGDGLQDGVEVDQYRTDPTAMDTDGDGLSDGAEINTHQTNPTKKDTDGDGLDDAAEVNRYETDPLSADTDGDGVSDPDEVDRSQFASPGLGRQLVLAGVIVVILVGIGVQRSDGAVLRRFLPAGVGGRPGGHDDRSPPSADHEVGETNGDTDAAGTARSVDPEAEDVSSETARVERTDAASVGTGPGDEAEEMDLDLLPNAQVVLAVLDENDGQIRQARLVEETGWSKAKVSRVLSQMEADEEIVKVSVGRGNLITTPDDVPPGVGSPFED